MSSGAEAFSKLIMTLLIPISLWGINEVISIHTDLSKVQTEIVERTGDRYTASDARRDNASTLALIEREQSDLTTMTSRQEHDEQFMYQHMKK